MTGEINGDATTPLVAERENEGLTIVAGRDESPLDLDPVNPARVVWR